MFAEAKVVQQIGTFLFRAVHACLSKFQFTLLQANNRYIRILPYMYVVCCKMSGIP